MLLIVTKSEEQSFWLLVELVDRLLPGLLIYADYVETACTDYVHTICAVKVRQTITKNKDMQ